MSYEMQESLSWSVFSRRNDDPVIKVRCTPRRYILAEYLWGPHCHCFWEYKHQQSPEAPKARPHLELCPVRLFPLRHTVLPALSFSLDCSLSSIGGPHRSVARMTQSQSCWRGSVWWCATPPPLRSHRVTLWACRWGQVLDGWHFQPSVTPTMNPRRWATAPWPSTLTRWVSAVSACRCPEH